MKSVMPCTLRKMITTGRTHRKMHFKKIRNKLDTKESQL